jgi:hypothetical protein
MTLLPVTSAIFFISSGKTWTSLISEMPLLLLRESSVSVCTVNSTSDYTLWTLYCSYFKGIIANIEMQVYNVTGVERLYSILLILVVHTSVSSFRSNNMVALIRRPACGPSPKFMTVIFFYYRLDDDCRCPVIY